jgi:hypothetical protein
MSLQGCCPQSLDSCAIPNISHPFDHLGPIAAQLRTSHRKPRTVNVRGHDPHALRRKSARDTSPDTAGRTGDYRNPARELLHSHLSSATTPSCQSRSTSRRSAGTVVHLAGHMIVVKGVI